MKTHKTQFLTIMTALMAAGITVSFPRKSGQEVRLIVYRLGFVQSPQGIDSLKRCEGVFDFKRFRCIQKGRTWSGKDQPSSGGGAPGGPGQQQGQQASALSYVLTYNLGTNQLYMTSLLRTEERRYTAFAQTVMLPDASHTRLLRISRRPMVTDSTKLALVNGMVRSREDVRPSGVFGWVGLPSVPKMAVRLPGRLRLGMSGKTKN